MVQPSTQVRLCLVSIIRAIKLSLLLSVVLVACVQRILETGVFQKGDSWRSVSWRNMRRCPSVYAQFGHTYDMYLSYTYKTANMRFDLSMCGTNDLKLICSKLELQISNLHYVLALKITILCLNMTKFTKIFFCNQ